MTGSLACFCSCLHLPVVTVGRRDGGPKVPDVGGTGVGQHPGAHGCHSDAVWGRYCYQMTGQWHQNEP